MSVLPEVNAITVVRATPPTSSASPTRWRNSTSRRPAGRALFPPAVRTAGPDRSAAGPARRAVDVVTLHAAIPGHRTARRRSTAADIAGVVMQALSANLPDLHITVYASQSQLLLTGSPSRSARAAV